MSVNRGGFAIDPVSRGLAVLAGLAGTMLCRDGYWLAMAWALTIIPGLVASPRFRRSNLKFMVMVWLPMAVALLGVWAWIVGAPPGAPLHSSPQNGLIFAAVTSLRILMLAGILQLCFLTLPAEELVTTARHWGLRGEGLLALMGTLSLMGELEQRARQVMTAQRARGLVRTNGWLDQARMAPRMLSPLLAWVMRTAIQRGEMWEHRGVLSRINLGGSEGRPPFSWAGAILVGLAFVWFALNLTVQMVHF